MNQSIRLCEVILGSSLILTGLKGGRDRMKSRMMSWASLLTFGGILPSTNTGFNLYLNKKGRSASCYPFWVA